MSIDLTDIGSGYNRGTINSNFTEIEAYLNDNVLKREVGVNEANEMRTDLDMNVNRIVNVVDGVDPQDAVTVYQLATAPVGPAGPQGEPGVNGEGTVAYVIGGTGITVDSTDPTQPIVNLDAGLPSFVASEYGIVDDASLNQTSLMQVMFDAVNIAGQSTVYIDVEVATVGPITITADCVRLTGSGTWWAHSSTSETNTQLLIVTGAYFTCDLSGGFNGGRDNTDTGLHTGNGTMVKLMGHHPTWNSRTANAEGYALDVQGKNPNIITHEDSNSQYSGIRFFALEAWDYVKAGTISCYRSNVGVNLGASERGLLFNGQAYIEQVNIESYVGRGTGMLFDSDASGTNLQTTWFGHVKFGNIDVTRTFSSTSPANQPLCKLENVKSVTVTGTWRIDTQIPEHKGFRINQDEVEFIKIGTLQTNRECDLPNTIPVTIDQVILEDGCLEYSQRMFASAAGPLYLNIGTIFTKMTRTPSTSYGIIRLYNQPSHIYVGKIVVVSGNEQYGTVSDCSYAGALVTDDSRFLHNISTLYISSLIKPALISRVPKQDVTNLQGAYQAGDRIEYLDPAAAGWLGEVCLAAGQDYAGALWKRFGNIAGPDLNTELFKGNWQRNPLEASSTLNGTTAPWIMTSNASDYLGMWTQLTEPMALGVTYELTYNVTTASPLNIALIRFGTDSEIKVGARVDIANGIVSFNAINVITFVCDEFQVGNTWFYAGARNDITSMTVGSISLKATISAPSS